MTWAAGTIATVRGPLRVEWRIEEHQLLVNIKAPKGVRTTFVKNKTMEGLEVKL